MTLHVERTGRGVPLLLLHGWGFHSRVWNGLGDRLARRFDVHKVDLPGHGRSRDAACGDLDSVADALADCVPDGSVVCGWSLGALVAQRFASRHPAKARALALISATPCFAARDDWPHGAALEPLERFSRGLREDVTGTLDAFLALNALGGANARATIRSLRRRLDELPPPRRDALDASLRILRDADLRAEAKQVAVAACVIHGGGDRIVPVGAGRWLANAIPAADFVEVPSGHLPFLDATDQVAEAIERLDG